MKTMFKLLPIVLLVLLVSCKKQLDINIDPVQPVTTTPSLRLPAILGNMAYHLYSHARYSSYHSFYITSRYNTSKIEALWNYNDVTRLGAWRWHYFDVGSNCRGMIERSESDGANNYKGVGKIMLAFSYLTATDSFGDMPFKEAYSGSYNPKYDTQQEVYAGIVSLLNEGIEDLNRSGASDPTMNATADLIYQGNLNKWKSFAEAVRARLLLHTANFDGGYDAVLSTVNASLTGFSDAVLKYPESPTRDWEKNMWGPSIPNPQWNFADIVNILNTSVSTDLFMKYLTVGDPGLNYDPRLYKLTSPGVKGAYNGARLSEGLVVPNWPTVPGTVAPTMDDFANLYNGYWTKDGSPFPYILKEELYFIKAEAAFYKNDNVTALAAYREGVKLNMQRLGITEGEIGSFLSSSKIKQDASLLTISDILVQKYVALYLQSETWVDMRRHGYSTEAYPGIYYPARVLTEWGGRWIQRLPYDNQTEYIYNPQEMARLGATSRSWVFTPVWWADRSTLKN
ncbi:SusD/RagB family nutrient-binding outer membrane lipoprotein [Pedobacter sp. MC2016-14]|uniref:SusD/RagB family nutrient-binding outer membrane lipoprotein n=1 Tax=Pedobacter sp. MC2016-14 TaxID=2897327 RepID=UPI001E5C34DE|nr:SusD/RagB family nutrient-binding outer membrane lipoprotein [Pedobacter sp. MC2016-14]MCD0487454.1 SusD/RagB family nutrient-binding outer membrane lipoprotein [Pedobacter sp. MC2016-14]